jgi:hypothetical protein
MRYDNEHLDELLRERAHHALDDLIVASALRVPDLPARGRRIKARPWRSQRLLVVAAGLALVVLVGGVAAGFHARLGSRRAAISSVTATAPTPNTRLHITFHADPRSVQLPLGAAVAPDGTLYLIDGESRDGSSPARIVRFVHGARESVTPADFGLSSATNSPSFAQAQVRVTAQGGLVVLIASRGNIANYLFGVTALGDATLLDRRSSVPRVSDGLAVDPAGNAFLGVIGCRCPSGNSGDSVTEYLVTGGSRRVVGTGNEGAAVADGSAATSGAIQPWGLAVGPDGALYIADAGDNRVRRVGSDGIITTVAGTGAAGAGGDGGPATSAQLNRPESITFDSHASLFIADAGNNRIREVTPAGTIRTVAGDGAAGSGGDGGMAIRAQLHNPAIVVALPDGSILLIEGDTLAGVTDARQVLADGTITSPSR